MMLGGCAKWATWREYQIGGEEIDVSSIAVQDSTDAHEVEMMDDRGIRFRVNCVGKTWDGAVRFSSEAGTLVAECTQPVPDRAFLEGLPVRERIPMRGEVQFVVERDEIVSGEVRLQPADHPECILEGRIVSKVRGRFGRTPVSPL
jgi:hypothetical protein